MTDNRFPPTPGLAKTVKAAQAAIDAHQDTLRLEDGNSPETGLWHLVWSLLDWCDAMNVDFDATVSEVRAEIRNAGPAR